MKQWIKDSAVVIGTLSLFVGLPLTMLASHDQANTTQKTAEVKSAVVEPTCQFSTIPFDTERKADANRYILQGDTTVTQGVNGTKKECRLPDGSLMESTVISQPVTKVISYGTKVYVAPPVTGTYRTGARCNDGTRSYATGSGACSWHDGVDYWLYE